MDGQCLNPIENIRFAIPAACTTASSQQTPAMQQVQATRGDLAVKVNGIGKIETFREARLAFGSAGRVDRYMLMRVIRSVAVTSWPGQEHMSAPVTERAR